MLSAALSSQLIMFPLTVGFQTNTEHHQVEQQGNPVLDPRGSSSTASRNAKQITQSYICGQNFILWHYHFVDVCIALLNQCQHTLLPPQKPWTQCTSKNYIMPQNINGKIKRLFSCICENKYFLIAFNLMYDVYIPLYIINCKVSL